MKLKPKSNYLLVLPDKPEEVTESGLLIPENSRQKPLRGVVKATGPGTTEDPMTDKEGDVVCYGQFSGIPVEHEGIEYLLIKASDVFYTLEQ